MKYHLASYEYVLFQKNEFRVQRGPPTICFPSASREILVLMRTFFAKSRHQTLCFVALGKPVLPAQQFWNIEKSHAKFNTRNFVKKMSSFPKDDRINLSLWKQKHQAPQCAGFGLCCQKTEKEFFSWRSCLLLGFLLVFFCVIVTQLAWGYLTSFFNLTTFIKLACQ